MTTPATESAATAVRAHAAHRPGNIGNGSARAGEDYLAELRHAIKHAAHLLPAQGPINVFIHHNTLHAFEQLSFTDALKSGAKIFGCQPYLSEERYRSELAKGRIRFAEVEAVLREDLGSRADEVILLNCTRLDLRLAMLQYPLRFAPTPELLWFVAETDALRKVRGDVSATVRSRLIAETRRWAMRDLRGTNSTLSGLLERDGLSPIETWEESQWEVFTLQAIWRIACQRMQTTPDFTPPPHLPVRHRDLLVQVTSEDPDLLVNELLTRFCAAYLDQGLAHWQLPGRKEGFYRAFIELYRLPAAPPQRWLRDLPQKLADWADRDVAPLEAILESLAALGVPENEWEEFISATLLALRGWAGMTRLVEERGDRAAHPIAPDSLTEMLAIRLLLDRLALQSLARDALNFTGDMAKLRDELRAQLPPHSGPSVEQRAFLVFQLAQVQAWKPAMLQRLSDVQWSKLLEEIESFSNIERRRVFHLAYERRFYAQALDALSLHKQQPPPVSLPRFQLVCCLDEREESFRRHLEELAPDVQTFGAAGFYAVAMYYRGAAEAYFRPQCPIVIQPGHWVCEEVVEDHQHDGHRRTQARKALGSAGHQFHKASRTFALGAIVSGALGVLASVPLIARILFPRLTARIRKRVGNMVRPPAATRLTLERTAATPGASEGELGFILPEMVNIGERLLRDIGMTSQFSRLVILLGHGSSSLNNPYRSAYDCGACGGSAGAANARACAQILNDPRVRAGLSERGIHIPAETVVIGGMHNTCDDSVTFSDVDKIPASHQDEFAAARRDIDTTRMRNAHERCRRFYSAPLTITPAGALQHVEARSEDLAQTRPELGHATNALCFVGRRSRVRGLFFDRRAFLTSYDPTQDTDDATVLTRTLGAVFPVCGGINLEYFFSHVDNYGFGSGTKLPHNVASLLGVMDGAASDLRTGLPWQMVEIHEPVRQMTVIETTPEVLLKIFERQPALGQFARNGWLQVAVLDPESSKIQVFRDGKFEPYEPQADRLPSAPTSVDWYRGWRNHLEFAEIGN
jgi:uncharacterized protein YbcC (UPF0753/DUF2309 family)